MFKRLDDVEKKYEGVAQQILDPNVINDNKKYALIMKEYSTLKEIVDVYREYKKIEQERKEAKNILETEKDADLRAMAKEELPVLEKSVEELSAKLKILLLPKDPNDDKNIILEIRAGAGGDEASLFSEELFRAYTHYAQKYRWSVEVLSTSASPVGGFKEVIASINGDKVFSRLKYESGVHRVQRVPKTETQGRVHTSTITVAVLPEVDEVEINIHPNDLKIDVFRAGGSGGQSVNTTDSAVRVTHLPTNTVVICQDEKSQLKNKNKAIKILAARIQDAEEQKQIKDASDKRLAQIGTGDRSERIRTYNFPQSRVTDHRINHTVYQIDTLMEGGIDLMIEPLITHYQTEALKNSQGT
ncbi:MAG: peptide chain release factor 1 [Bdellovibrionota bacterium]